MTAFHPGAWLKPPTSKLAISLIVAMIIMLGTPPKLAYAQATLSPITQQWFVALTQVKRRAFEELLTEDAKIELRDLGITQTKEEFISALDEWERATRGAILLTHPVSSEAGKDVLEVCYRFESNEQLNRETYYSADGKITKVIQERIGAVCEGF